MKKLATHIIPICIVMLFLTASTAQNVGINCLIPLGKLHIKGSSNTSQYIIDAHSTQGNTNPLIRLRNSNGSDLMWIHSDNPANVFIGTNTGNSNTAGILDGIYNSFIGNLVGYSNTTGSMNTAIGAYSLTSNTTGPQNTAIGMQALSLNTKGKENTAIGSMAMNGNTTANRNVAVGVDALRTQSYSNNNTNYDTYNVAIGYQSLYFNQPISTDGYGRYNTAVGTRACYSNTIGFENTANGSYALYNNINGIHNSATGAGALLNNSSGSGNTAIGKQALSSNVTGWFNTSVGKSASFSSTDLDNTTCIGNYAGGVLDADNRIEIGNTSISWIGGQQTWSTYSDARIKDNVEANVPGLNFINLLRPVTYNLNIHRQNEMVHAGREEMGEWDSKYDVENMRITGFIAQEVAQAAEATGYEFSGVEIPTDPNDLYSVRYSDFVMPLVKAAQELSEKNNGQEIIIADLIQRIEILEARIGDQ